MPVETPRVEPELLDTLKLAEEGRCFIGARGFPLDMWEALLLADRERDLLRREVRRYRNDRRVGAPTKKFQRSARAVRERFSDQADSLRWFLGSLPVSMDAVRLELLVALTLLRPEQRAQADGWLWSQAEARRNAPSEIAPLSALADLLRMELVRWRAGRPTEIRRKPSVSLDEDILADLRCTRRAKAVFDEIGAAVSFWELLCLTVCDRGVIRHAIAQFAAARRGLEPRDLGRSQVVLLEALLAVRGRYGEMARRLLEYASGLPIGRYGDDVMELALGFVMGSPEGRRRARRWLEDPDSFRREAALRLEGVIGRAMNYLAALRSAPAA